MAIIEDFKKATEMSLRVYNNTMIQEDKESNVLGDEKAIKALCEATFGDGSVNPDPVALHQFNNIVVRTADVVAQPQLEQLLNYFANYQTVPANTQMVEYDKPMPVGLKFKWTAVGSDVALKRVEAGEVDYIKISHIQTGISYNPLTNSARCVENYRALVQDVANAKVRMVYEELMSLLQKAIANGDIPAQQIVDKTGVAYADLKKVASHIARRTGSRPIFLADRVLIDHFADAIQTGASTILVDNVKDSMYNYELTNLRCVDAIPLVNNFTTIKGFATEFPVNRGYVLGSAGTTKKPFEVAVAGGLVQHTENEFVHGRVKMIIRQGLGIDLLCGEQIGYIENDDLAI